jgi:hypothetical protein
MLGFEKMMAQMLGMTPEEMQQAAVRMRDGLLTVATKLETIDGKCDQILAQMEEGNGRTKRRANGSDRNNAGKRSLPGPGN